MCAYLLDVIAVLVSLSSREGQSGVGFELRGLWEQQPLMMELMRQVDTTEGRGGVTLLYLLN